MDREVRRRLGLLARTKHAHRRELRKLAEKWLNDRLRVEAIHATVNFSKRGASLVYTPVAFPSRETKHAVAFATLVGHGAPALIASCTRCKNFFVKLPRPGRPFETCPAHHNDTAVARTTRSRKFRKCRLGCARSTPRA